MFVPGTKVALLTHTSKMPCDSWSLPAVKSCPGAFFAENAICGTSKEHTTCYATGGMYLWDAVKNAQHVRYMWTLKCLSTNEGIAEWFDTMIPAIANRRRNQEYFRVHDSGDLFNARYIQAWYYVCESLPNIDFWFPTRSWRLPNLLPHLVWLNSLPNVQVKPSALLFEDEPPVIAGLSGGTSASKTTYTCPAHSQNNECRDCRACWTESPKIYRKH
jgi:hypothetical protein